MQHRKNVQQNNWLHTEPHGFSQIWTSGFKLKIWCFVPDVWKPYKVWDLFPLGFNNVAVHKYNYIQHLMPDYAPSNSCHWTLLMSVPPKIHSATITTLKLINLKLFQWVVDMCTMMPWNIHQSVLLSVHSIWYQHLQNHDAHLTEHGEMTRLHVTNVQTTIELSLK